MRECIDKLYKKVSEQSVVCPSCGEISTIGKSLHLLVGRYCVGLRFRCPKCKVIEVI